MTIGDRLKELRLKHAYTLEYVSTQLNFSKQTLQRYESGVITNIPSDKIESLAKIYQTTPSYIMGWESKNKDESITIAAHATKDLTEEEQEKVLDYVKYIKSQRKKDK